MDNNNNLSELLDTKKKNIKVENLSMSVGELNSMYRDNELIYIRCCYLEQ